MAKANLLIVEDEAIISLDIKQRLERMGFSVLDIVGSGETAIARAVETRPDLILMDINLRGEYDGVETTAMIRQQVDIPVIYLTAYADDATFSRARATAPSGYLLKPVQDEVLRTTIELALHKHASESRIRASEERFRMLFELSPDGIALFDPNDDMKDWRIVDCNQQYSQMNGFTRDELLGQPLDLLLDDESFYVEVDLGQPGPHRGNAIHRRRDGTKLHVEYTASCIEISGKQFVLGIDRDISDRLEAEKKLYAAQQRLQTVINTIPHSVYWKDHQSVYIGSNEAFAKSVGFNSAHEIIGKTDYEFTSRGLASAYYADDQQVIEQNQPKYNYIEKQMLADGTGIWAETSKIPLHDIDGQSIGVLGVSKDITEKLAAETALRESESQFRALIEQFPLALQVFTADGTLIMVNENWEKSWKSQADNMIGIYNLLKDPKLKEKGLESFLERSLQGQQVDIPDIQYLIGGELRWIRTHASPILGEDSSVRYVVILSEDITEYKLAEVQRAELAVEKERIRLLSEFITGVSHEFRTPLSIIHTSLYTLSADPVMQHHASRLDAIREQSTLINELIETMLTMLRLDSSSTDQFEPIVLLGLFQELEAAIATQANAKALQIDFQVDENLAPVNGNYRNLRLAILSLLNNAIANTPDNGSIRVRAFTDDYQVIISVIDTGVGIPDKDLPHIFDRFYRGDNAHTTRGFGLGLPIALKIVELHNGHIKVDTQEGGGSTFTITLPATIHAERHLKRSDWFSSG